MKVHCRRQGKKLQHRAEPEGWQGKGSAQVHGTEQGEGWGVYDRGDSVEEKTRRCDWWAEGGGGGGLGHVGKE